MRFILFDKIVSLEKMVGGVGIKNVTIGEEFFVSHYSRKPIMPESLILESIAQIGGWVITLSSGYKYSTILAKIGAARFSNIVRPGDQLCIHIEIVLFNDYGSSIKGVAKVGNEVVAEVDNIVYVHHENDERNIKETMKSYIFNSGGFLDKESTS